MTTQRPTRTNKVLAINPKGKWSNESFETTMDAIEHDITSLWGPDKFWGILVTSLSDHLNGKTKSRKIGPPGVLIEEEEGEVVVAWVLNMQERGLFITLQQFKWKVVEVTLIRPTTF